MTAALTPYPEMRDSGVEWLGEIPDHWHGVELKRIAPARPAAAVASPPDESTIWHLDLEHIAANTGRVRVKHRATISEIGSSTVWFDESNVLYSKLRPYLNKVVTPDEPGIATSELIPLSPNPCVVTRSFLAYYLLSPGFVAHASRHVSGTKMPRVIPTLFWSHTVPLPPPPEQHAIARFLDDQTAKIDALVAKQRELIAQLREKRTALISHAVTKGLDADVAMKDSGVEWLGEVPTHWEIRRTKYAAKLRSGHTPSRQKPEYWKGCTIPWFGLADIWQIRDGQVEYVQETAEKISEIGLANSAARLLPEGTVILSRTASVGFSAILGVDMATTQDFVNWICGPSLRPDYLLYAFRAMGPEFQRLTMGSTHQTIYMHDVASFSTPVPPITEQDLIVSFVRRETAKIDALIAKSDDAIELLHEYRTALISAAVTGKIDVRHRT